MDLVIQNGLSYTPEGLREVDIGIDGSRIAELGEHLQGDEIIDADGGLVLPGLVNAHTHSPMTLLRGYADDLKFDVWLNDHILPIEEHLTEEHISAGAKLAALEMIKSGTTTFGDMYYSMDRVAATATEAGLRARLGNVVFTTGQSEDASKRTIQEVVQTTDEFDGQSAGRINGMATPHAPYTCDDWALKDVKSIAESRDWPFHLHVNETSDEVNELTEQYENPPITHLHELGVLDQNSYLAHCVHLTEEEISVLADQSVSVAHCPTANMKLAAGMAPLRRLQAANVNVCLGTDGVASNNNLDMLEEMKFAALLAKVREEDATVTTAQTVIDMATVNGARALNLDTGVIAKGKLADLIVLDLDTAHLSPRRDLLSHVVYAANGGDVDSTIVNGRVLMKNQDVLTLDEEAIRTNADAASQDLIDRHIG